MKVGNPLRLLIIFVLLFLFNVLVVNSNEKLGILVITFDDLTGSSAGSAVPTYITSKINDSSYYSATFNSKYRKSNLSEAFTFAQKNSFDLLLTGTVKQNSVNYSYVNVPSPWGRVRVKNVTITINFEVTVYSVSNQQVLIKKDFSHTESFSDVGAWVFTDWGTVDVNSYGFRKTPIGVVLDKLCQKLVKNLEEEYSRIKSEVKKVINSSDEQKNFQSAQNVGQTVQVGPDALLEGLDTSKYQVIKLYENNLNNLPKGTTQFGLTQLSYYRVFAVDVSPNVVKPLLDVQYSALQVNKNPYKMPLFIDVNIIPSKVNGDFIILIGKLKKNKNDFYFNGISVFVSFKSTGLESRAYLLENFKISEHLDYYTEKYDVLAGNTIEGSFYQNNINIKTLFTQNKLRLIFNNIELINIPITNEILSKVDINSNIVCLKGSKSFIDNISIYGLKSKDEKANSNRGDVEEIEKYLEQLGAMINKDDLNYIVTFKQKDLFKIDSKKNVIVSKSEKFENVMDLINKMVISLNASDLKVKLQLGSQENINKAKNYIQSYFNDISSGSYKLLFLTPDLKNGDIIFKISRI